MNSNETVETATETHEFEVSTDGHWGGDPNCAHNTEQVNGEQRDWDESLGAYVVSFIYRCLCGAERVEQQAPEEGQ